MEPRFDSELQDALVKLLESGVAMAKTKVMDSPILVARFINTLDRLAFIPVEPNSERAEQYMNAKCVDE